MHRRYTDVQAAPPTFANSKVEKFIEEVLKLIDNAHAKGHREGVFLDKYSVLQEQEFFELDWYDIEATFYDRMKKEE